MGACMVKQDSATKASTVAPYISPQPKLPRARLYGVELCPFTSRVRIALQYKGILVQPVWLTSEDLKGNKLDWLSSVCPDGKLPIFQHEDQTICGSSDAIIEYIETRFPNPPLLPCGPLAKDVQKWVEYIQNNFTPLLGQVLYDGNPFVQQNLAPQLEASFTGLDDALKQYSTKGPFFFGDQFTLADVYLIPFLLLVRPLTYFRGLEIKSDHSYLLAYSRRMVLFPSYAPVRIDLDLLGISIARALQERAPAPLVLLTTLQHQSILFHMEKLVQIADELVLVAKHNTKVIDPIKGSIGMQIRNLSLRYGQLLDLMQEHAQMEERVIFPALEKADRGVTKSANEEHARDLPVMNGIHGDIKAVLTLQQGSDTRNEALIALATRFHKLQAHTIEHYHDEETELLPLLDAAGVGSKQQAALVEKCSSLMEASHGNLFPYLLSGLAPHQIHQYVDLLQRCLGPNLMEQIAEALQHSVDELAFVWKVVQERIPSLAHQWYGAPAEKLIKC